MEKKTREEKGGREKKLENERERQRIGEKLKPFSIGRKNMYTKVTIPKTS